MRIFCLIFFLTFFLGCQKKPTTFDNNTNYTNEALTNTKKQNFEINKTEYITILIRTSELNEKYYDKNTEKFIIGFYPHLDIDDSFSFKLNSSSSLKVEKLDNDDEKLIFLPFVNEWSEYYLIEFPKQDNSILTFCLEKNQLNVVSLDFEQEWSY